MTVVRLEGRGLDVINAPAITKDRPDLSLADSARSPIPGLLVAETHQEVGTAGPNDSPEALREAGTLFVGEHVEQPGINGGVERPRWHRKVERVGDLELSLETTSFRFGPGLPDRRRRAVDSRRGKATLGQV